MVEGGKCKHERTRKNTAGFLDRGKDHLWGLAMDSDVRPICVFVFFSSYI